LRSCARLAKSVRAEAHDEVKQAEREAERRVAKAEEELEEALAEDEGGDEGGDRGQRGPALVGRPGRPRRSPRRPMRLLPAGWAGGCAPTGSARPPALEEASIGFDQEPVPGEYSYTPPI
jgi:hypothetical protein